MVTAWPFIELGNRQCARLREHGCELHDLSTEAPLSASRLRDLLPGIEAVIATSDEYSATALAGADSLRLIARWGVGVDSIDLQAAAEKGIIVTNTPGYLTEAVADFTFGLLLAAARRIPQLHLRMREGIFARRESPGPGVWRKTLGIIGLGEIGKAVARRARGFAMQVLASDLQHDDEFASRYQIRYVPLKELLRRSDFVTLHCALTPTTTGLIGENELRLMKRTAFLINAARGAVVDEQALLRALQERWIAGAALDTFCVEPLPPGHPLTALDNCVLTPHVASCSLEAIEDINELLCQNVLAVLRGQEPRHIVNRPRQVND